MLNIHAHITAVHMHVFYNTSDSVNGIYFWEYSRKISI